MNIMRKAVAKNNLAKLKSRRRQIQELSFEINGSAPPSNTHKAREIEMRSALIAIAAAA